MNYSMPKWYTIYWTADKVTTEMLAEWEKDTVAVNESNTTLFKEKAEKYHKLMVDAILLFGEKSAEIKYLMKARPMRPQHYDFSQVKSKVDLYRAQVAREAEQKICNERHEALKTRAIIWLQKEGKVLDKDFSLANAILTANNLAFLKEVERLKSKTTFYFFEGQNCDGPCNGWDGVSNRCECGNRRVSWQAGMSHTFEQPYVYGEAY